MRMLSTFSLAKEIALKLNLPVRQYLMENRLHFLDKLFERQLFVYNASNGVEMIEPADVTLVGANQICFGPHPRKTVAQHHLEKGRPLEYPSLQCIAVRRSSNHYDYFPVELVFYVTA